MGDPSNGNDAAATSEDIEARLRRAFGPAAGEALGRMAPEISGTGLGDWLRTKRMDNLDRLHRQWQREIAHRNVDADALRRIGEGHLGRIVESIANEGDDTLIDLWARFLANALDPESTTGLGGTLIETFASFEALDARLLLRIGDERIRRQRPACRRDLSESLTAPDDRIAASLDHLVALRCLRAPTPGDDPSGDRDDDALDLTVLGIELYRACVPDKED